MDAHRSHAPLVAGAYFLHFCTVGVSLPYLPAYFKNLGLSGAEIGVLLAIAPTLTLLVPPFWGGLADRTGRPEWVLALVLGGAALGFTPLLFAGAFPTLALGLVLYGVFICGVTALMDSLALREVARHGGDYARVRLFGSLGFVVATAVTGLAIDVVDRSAAVAVLALLAATSLYGLLLAARLSQEGRTITLAASRPARARELLRVPGVARLCAASCLHWIAGAPFHGTFAIHVGALGHAPWVVGLATGSGVLAETFVMAIFPALSRRASERRLLVVAFGVSVLRWVGMAFAVSAPAIVALTLLHGFTFGAFYAAAIGALARRVPESARATGQALFASITFGVGGLAGYLLAGLGYDGFGGHGLYGAGAAVEVLALVVVAGLRPAR